METLWRSGPASSSSAPPASSNALSFPAYRVWIFDDASDSSSSSQLVVDGNRWNISTNYYTAGVSVWLVHLHDEFFIESLPMYEQLAALILVFDTTELSSLSALQEWVSQTDLQKFDILVCVGNIEDDCRSLETRLLMPVQGSLRMESPRLKEAVYWGMTSHFGGLATHVWNGALSITLSSLKLALQILILTNVRFVS
ncbi:uncharacterized protein [Malus domestica]|uniref:uncharacterized protein isoform X3 n=1 Tax=Malus domestica TaxID=3750 RepID=UPI0039760799